MGFFFIKTIYLRSLNDPIIVKILIVAATRAEIEPFLKRTNPINMQDIVFQSYSYNTHAVDILVTGIGMLLTAHQLTRQLSAESYNLIINAGIAGTIAIK